MSLPVHLNHGSPRLPPTSAGTLAPFVGNAPEDIPIRASAWTRYAVRRTAAHGRSGINVDWRRSAIGQPCGPRQTEWPPSKCCTAGAHPGAATGRPRRWSSDRHSGREVVVRGTLHRSRLCGRCRRSRVSQSGPLPAHCRPFSEPRTSQRTSDLNLHGHLSIRCASGGIPVIRAARSEDARPRSHRPACACCRTESGSSLERLHCRRQSMSWNCCRPPLCGDQCMVP